MLSDNSIRMGTALWVLWLGLCVFANGTVAPGVGGSLIWLLLLIGVWAMTRLLQPENSRIRIQAFGVLLGFAVAMTAVLPLQLLISPNGNARLAGDVGKILILIVGTVAVRSMMRAHALTVVRTVPVLITGLIVHAYLSGSWDYYDPLRLRFGAPSLGSPNTLGYLLAFSLLMIRFCYRRSTNRAGRGALAVMELVQLAALAGTQSRGGIILYIMGLLVFVKTNRTRLGIVGAILLAEMALGAVRLSHHVDIERFDLVRDLVQTGGTGRFAIWGILLGKMLNAPLSILIGFGPGSIGFWRQGDFVNDAHSLLVESFYYYGILGLAVLGSCFWWLLKKQSFRAAESWDRLRVSFVCMFMLGATYDNYPFAARALWFTCLVLSVIAFEGKESGESGKPPLSTVAYEHR